MAVVGDVIVSKVIEKLVEVGFKYAADHCFARRRRMKDELERLNDVLPHIQAVVEAVESGQREITGALNKWLWKLKDAVYMADDVLDDLDYNRIEKQMKMNDARRRPNGCKVRGFIFDSKRKVSNFSKRAFKSDPTLNKLRGAVKRLNEVALGVKDFITLQEFNQLQQQQHHQTQIVASSNRETGPILRDSNVLGRDGERKEVLQWLKRMPDADEDNKENISLFSIVGLGGVGKTTLVQLIYNDDTLKSSFDILLWACVSTPFDVKKIMADILECGTKKRPEVGGLGPLGEALKAQLVSSKKFLLVLDDAWDDGDLSSWEILFAPLRSGQKGSKILLTTRSEKVAEKAAVALGGSVKKPMRLEPLHSDDFLSLFNRYAFAGVNRRDYRKLESLGEQIAGRLGGLPLAAKTIGALLRSNLDEIHWKNILQSSHISDHAQQRDDVMPILMLSYRYLPTHLRRCFAFCSVFPQDYMFIKDDLVLMWMALGFIQQSTQNSAETLEDIGSRYFDDLAKLSFFEQRGLSYTDPVTREVQESPYIMHDLLHDLAQRVSYDECFRFVEGMSINQIPKTVRHLRFETNDLDLLKNMDKWRNLHTLILIFKEYKDEHAVTFEQVFESLESIRVLSITAEGKEVLSDATGKLRHLRYLSIRHRITRLPSSICKLYHLQALEIRLINYTDTPSVLVLKNLINLRHLLPWGVPYANIDGIGTLTSLQRLFFDAGAYKLSELKDLRELQVLVVSGLKNDQHGEEVSLLQLHGKKRLHRLDLWWSEDDYNSDAAEEYEKVLDGLHPPDSLKQLGIEGYQGARSPCWMEEESLKNLEEIFLSDNTGWEHLPSLGKLPYLNKLVLRSLTALKQIGFEGGFQQLKVLDIRGCGQWEEWSGLETAETAAHCWPLLGELRIMDCPKLKALPPLPLGLERLELENVGLSDSSALEQIGFEGGFQQLKVLDISNCPELKALPPLPLGLKRLRLVNVGLSDSPTFCLTTPSSSSPSLYEIRIQRCEKLTSVAGFQHLRSIESLRIENCPKLKMATDAVAPIDCFPLSSLKYLTLSHCGELDRLVQPLLMQGALTSLSVLELGGCNHITSFPSEEACRRSLTSLKYLTLLHCGELTSVEGLKALSHLDYLWIEGCPKLVQAAASSSSASNKGKEEEEEFTLTVDTLDIDDPLLLHIEPLRKLTSVRELGIGDCRNLEGEGDVNSWLLQNRTSLQDIILENYTAKFLPCGLQALSSLSYLNIDEACELQSLPQMPSSLRELRISDCSGALKERCLEDEGADWPNIKHIPHIEIRARGE